MRIKDDLLDRLLLLAVVGLRFLVETLKDDLQLNIAAILVFLKVSVSDGMREFIRRPAAGQKVLKRSRIKLSFKHSLLSFKLLWVNAGQTAVPQRFIHQFAVG